MENNGIFENKEQQAGDSKKSLPEQILNEVKNIFKVYWQKFLNNSLLQAAIRNSFIYFVTIVTILIAFVYLIYIVPFLQEIPNPGRGSTVKSGELAGDAIYMKEIASMKRDIQRMNRDYNAYTSGQSYIIINTTENRFFLYRNKKLVREGFCSSGSYTLLQAEGDKHWIFKTPKGKYRILGKTTNPVWKKPDWAFVEEGLPIPPMGHSSRYEYGVLGDYSLAIGDGYLIHGTLYKRFLGMPVTHGCVRLNDEDLEVIYNSLSIGSKVYIF
jgi:hypothetical protein